MYLSALVATLAPLLLQPTLDHATAYQRCLAGISKIAQRAPCTETTAFASRPFHRRQIVGVVGGSVATRSTGSISHTDMTRVIGILPILPKDLPATDPLIQRFTNPAVLLDGMASNEVAVKVSDLHHYSDWYIGLAFQQWDAIRTDSRNARWKTVKRAGRILRLVDNRYGRLLDAQRKNLPTGRSVTRIVPEVVTIDSKSTIVANLRKLFEPRSDLELKQLTALFYMQLFLEHASASAPSLRERFAWEVAAMERLRTVRWVPDK